MPPQDHSRNGYGEIDRKEEDPPNSIRRSSLCVDQDCEIDDGEQQQQPTPRDSDAIFRPGGEPERLAFESRRALRESQGRVLANRRRSFIVEFSEMKGPPQIALLMALLAVGLGSTIGVVPAVMADRFARLYHGYEGDIHCDNFGTGDPKPEACFLGSSDAQAAASMANLVNNGLTFLTASLCGSLSDEFGRKGPLLLGLTMAMVPAFCLYVMQSAPGMSPYWYYSTSAMNGLVSWMAIALSALNDVLPQEFRAPGIGLLFAGLLFGISLSPTLALTLDRKTLCLVSFGVVCLGFLLTIFFVPETLQPSVGEAAKKRRMEQNAQEDASDRLSAVEESPNRCTTGLRKVYYGSWLCRTVRRGITRPFIELSILNRNSFFRMIAALAFFTGMVTSGDQVLLIYYLEDQMAFDAKDVSIMFLIIGITGIFVQVVVMKPLNDHVGEKMVVALSFVAGMIVNLLYGVARHKSTIFLALLISGFSNMSFPTISAIKANNVESSEQGRIQGALYSVKALASGVGPALLQCVYSRTKNYDGILWGPGTMFLFASSLFVVAIGLALALPNDKTNTNPRFGGRPAPSEEGGMPSAAMAIEYRRLAEESSSLSEDDASEAYGSI